MSNLTSRKRHKDIEGTYISFHLVEGTIIAIDLDEFSEVVREKGWSEYKPNPATGLLTMLVEEFVRKWQGVIVYGLDEERGTEEAVIEIPYVEPEEVERDLLRIKEELNKLGVRVTIVAIKDYVIAKPANQHEAYYGTPGRKRAHELLRKIKRKGGNQVVIA